MSVTSSMDSTYGAALIGLVSSAVLYGVTLLQTYLYWRKYPSDAGFIKFLVVLLLFLDTLHLVLCTTAIYTYLITNYMNPYALGRSTWSMNLQTDCNGLIGLIVECYFARRVWILSRNVVLVVVIVILSCVHFTLGVYFTVQEFMLVDLSKFAELIWVTSTGLGSAAAADTIIAISLCYYLMKTRTGYSRTDPIISTLIGYSITTGMITSIIAVLCVILFAVMPSNYIWLGFFWLIGKCYVNSFLAALNSREALREKVQLDGSLQLTSMGAMEAARTQDGHLRISSIDKSGYWEMVTEQQAVGAVKQDTQTVGSGYF